MPMTWNEKLRGLTESLGRKPTLDEMIELSRQHKMTDEEIEQQRQSWVRANMRTGDPRFD